MINDVVVLFLCFATHFVVHQRLNCPCEEICRTSFLSCHADACTSHSSQANSVELRTLCLTRRKCHVINGLYYQVITVTFEDCVRQSDF